MWAFCLFNLNFKPPFSISKYQYLIILKLISYALYLTRTLYETVYTCGTSINHYKCSTVCIKFLYRSCLKCPIHQEMSRCVCVLWVLYYTYTSCSSGLYFRTHCHQPPICDNCNWICYLSAVILSFFSLICAASF